MMAFFAVTGFVIAGAFVKTGIYWAWYVFSGVLVLINSALMCKYAWTLSSQHATNLSSI